VCNTCLVESCSQLLRQPPECGRALHPLRVNPRMVVLGREKQIDRHALERVRRKCYAQLVEGCRVDNLEEQLQSLLDGHDGDRVLLP
jgi:hypothetical protein